MIEANAIAIFGPLMPIIVELLKVVMPKVNPRYLSIAVCGVVALSVGFSLMYFGHERVELAMQSAVATAGVVFAIGTGLYKLTGSHGKAR